MRLQGKVQNNRILDYIIPKIKKSRHKLHRDLAISLTTLFFDNNIRFSVCTADNIANRLNYARF